MFYDLSYLSMPKKDVKGSLYNIVNLSKNKSYYSISQCSKKSTHSVAENPMPSFQVSWRLLAGIVNMLNKTPIN